jgi:predicted aspartyl protease
MRGVLTPPTMSFTARCDRLSRVLLSKADITEAFNPATSPPPKNHQTFFAIWDTGATNTVISQRVASACGLKPTGMAKVHTANDERLAATYLISIMLPNHVAFTNLRVSEGTIAGDADLLIGMDIIGKGDFAVTNRDGKTVFSFRMPSCECIDFTLSNPPSSPPTVPNPISGTAGPSPNPPVGRRQPCPCGSGKKYKNCCEKKR